MSAILLQQGFMRAVCAVTRNHVEAHVIRVPLTEKSKEDYVCHDIDDCADTEVRRDMEGP